MLLLAVFFAATNHCERRVVTITHTPASVHLPTARIRRQFLGCIYKYFLRPSKNLKKLGEWAVVTGATDGIGKAYAFKFAKKGLNIVIISRTKAKLDTVKDEIEEKYPGVSVKVVVCDYSDFNPTVRSKVSSATVRS